VDQTGTYVFETNPEGLGTTMSRDMTYWSIAGGSDTMISLWKSSGNAEDISVLFYVSGVQKPYTLPVHRRSLIACGVIRASIRFKASSYKWRAKPRLGAWVQRDFSEQVPQSPVEALYIV
jgi:hypothetical protein